MTAGPDRSPDRPAAWFVATDQGVVLAGPCADWPQALLARARVLARLREDLEREGRSSAFIASRCAVVAPRWGVLIGAWQRFEPVDVDAPHER